MVTFADPRVDPVIEAADKRTRRLTLSVPPATMRSWIAAADRCGMPLNDWVVLGIALADHLALIEGVSRLPFGGERIDPLLAEAIRRAAVGQPWEHKAMMLLGAPALVPNPHNSQAPAPQAARWAQTDDFHGNAAVARMVEYGLPVSAPTRHAAHYTTLEGEVFTWHQTALLLAIWHHSQNGWAHLRYKDMVRESGLSQRQIQNVVKNLGQRGILLREPVSPVKPVGEARFRTKIASPYAEALLRGELRLLQASDLRTEQFAARPTMADTNQPDEDVLWARKRVAEDHPMRRALVRKLANDRKRKREKEALAKQGRT